MEMWNTSIKKKKKYILNPNTRAVLKKTICDTIIVWKKSSLNILLKISFCVTQKIIIHTNVNTTRWNVNADKIFIFWGELFL